MLVLKIGASALLIAVIASAVYIKDYREQKQIKSDGIANCIEGYVGYSVKGEPWDIYAEMPTNTILKEVKLYSPHPENVINNCLGRPIE